MAFFLFFFFLFACGSAPRVVRSFCSVIRKAIDYLASPNACNRKCSFPLCKALQMMMQAPDICSPFQADLLIIIMV